MEKIKEADFRSNMKPPGKKILEILSKTIELADTIAFEGNFGFIRFYEDDGYYYIQFRTRSPKGVFIGSEYNRMYRNGEGNYMNHIEDKLYFKTEDPRELIIFIELIYHMGVKKNDLSTLSKIKEIEINIPILSEIFAYKCLSENLPMTLKHLLDSMSKDKLRFIKYVSFTLAIIIKRLLNDRSPNFYGMGDGHIKPIVYKKEAVGVLVDESIKNNDESTSVLLLIYTTFYADIEAFNKLKTKVNFNTTYDIGDIYTYNGLGTYLLRNLEPASPSDLGNNQWKKRYEMGEIISNYANIFNEFPNNGRGHSWKEKSEPKPEPNPTPEPKKELGFLKRFKNFFR